MTTTQQKRRRAANFLSAWDTQRVRHGTYLVVEYVNWESPVANRNRYVRRLEQRKTLYGAYHWTDRQDDLLSTLIICRLIRAFFIHPDWSPHAAVATLLLEAAKRGKISGRSVALRWRNPPPGRSCSHPLLPTRRNFWWGFHLTTDSRLPIIHMEKQARTNSRHLAPLRLPGCNDLRPTEALVPARFSSSAALATPSRESFRRAC